MKTKKAMKKITHIGMAALVAMGVLGSSCNKAESPEIETPETQKENIVTLTTTVGFAADDTKALTSTGVKTFAVGETMAVIYHNGTSFVKAVSHALEAGDITNEGKNATFTFDLATPNKSGDVLYIYPAAMAGDTGVDVTKLNTQEGTFDALQSKYDLCTNFGAWDGENLPSLTLDNQLAILAITLKNEAGTSDITSSITGLTLSDGTNTYNVNREAVAGPIYVAIFPTADATITVTATDGTTKNYTKTLTTTKTYAIGNGYPVSWKMTQVATDLSTLTAAHTAQNGDILTGTLGSNVKISIADGASVTLKDVTINGTNDEDYGWAGISCLGDATITLEGTNTVKGFHENYPGIHVPEGKTLTIQGEGSLNASDNGLSAGIGGGDKLSCGNIVIKGGTVTATGGDYAAGIGGVEGSCGAITIRGGTVTATGGYRGAGIGSGNYGSCGAITISGGTVTATGGNDGAGIGSGETGSFDAITISGGTVTATGVDWAAGIGGGCSNNTCGTITIKSTVTKVTATKGSYAPYSIGAGGDGGVGITLTIAPGANVIQN